MKNFLLICLGVIVGAIALGVSTDEATYWPRWARLKIGNPAPDTNSVYIYFEDGKMYFMDYEGVNRKRLRIGDLDFRISYADSLMRTPYIQIGTGLPAVASFPYGLFTNVDALFYTTNLYVKDGLTIADYSGNGARLKFINATGVQILNNKGVAFQVAQNAAAGAWIVDSAQITGIAPKMTLTSGSTALQFLANSGSYGWFGTSTNDPLYIGTNNSGRLQITAAGASIFSSTVTSTQFKLSALNTAPANAGDTGTLGEIRIVDGYIYVCTATNTWKRAAIAAW